MSRPSFLIRGLNVVYIVASEKTTNAKRNAQRLGSLVQGGIISAYEDYDTYYGEENLEPDYYIEDADVFYDWYTLSEKEKLELEMHEASMYDDYWDYISDDEYSFDESIYESVLSDEDRHF